MNFTCNPMKLVVITSPETLAHEADIINDLFDAGLRCLHLRKPAHDVTTYAALLNGIHENHHQYISLHQHHGLTKDFGITRLHYTGLASAEAAPEVLELQKESGYTLSTSIHQLEELPHLQAFDYVFYGPVFNSLSKPGYQSSRPAGFKLEQIGGPKVIALGGIELPQIPLVREMNFDGIAILGAIWNKPGQALKNFKQIQENMPVKTATR